MPKSETNFYIVLDMDETLLHTLFGNIEKIKKENIFTDKKHFHIRNRIYRFLYKRGEEFWGIFRPHIKEFLTWCHSYFVKVIIWSAGEKVYVEKAINEIVKSTGIPPFDIILTRNDCSTVDKNLTKPLDYIFKKVSGANEKNTFIIDDRIDNFHHNPRNGILIPQYHPSYDIDGIKEDDDTLLLIKKWFEKPEVKRSVDIRTLSKEIF